MLVTEKYYNSQKRFNIWLTLFKWIFLKNKAKIAKNKLLQNFLLYNSLLDLLNYNCGLPFINKNIYQNASHNPQHTKISLTQPGLNSI